MEKINFENLPSTNTPINATNLNQLQTNVENAITGVENSLKLLKIQHTETLNLSTNTTYFGNFSLDIPDGYEVVNIIVTPQYSDKNFGLANCIQSADIVFYCIFVNYPTQQNDVDFYIYCKKTDEILEK